MKIFSLTHLILLNWIVRNTACLQHHRIVGGKATSVAKHPFIVSFQHVQRAHLCGGSILTFAWVLSAAHCVCEIHSTTTTRNPDQHIVVAGSGDIRMMNVGEIRAVKGFIRHPRYQTANLHNDIALIKLKKPFHASPTVQRVNMPEEYLREASLRDKFRCCSAIGWGLQSPRRSGPSKVPDGRRRSLVNEDVVASSLRIVKLPLISNQKCQELENDVLITSRHLCTMFGKGGKDACVGDSGGPLMCGNVLFGVISWGEGCAMPNKPGIYTRVDTYLDWINNVIVNHTNKDERSLKYGRNTSSVFSMSHSVIVLFHAIYAFII